MQMRGAVLKQFTRGQGFRTHLLAKHPALTTDDVLATMSAAAAAADAALAAATAPTDGSHQTATAHSIAATVREQPPGIAAAARGDLAELQRLVFPFPIPLLYPSAPYTLSV
jgi:hypothetical protein